MKLERYQGDLLLLLVAIIWGFGFVAVKIGLNDGMPPYFLLAARFTIAFIAILPFKYASLKKISKKTVFNGTVLGVLLFLGFTFQTLGLQWTTTSKNAFLTGVNVVIVPFLAWGLTKKKPDNYSIVAAFICLAGIGFLTLDGRFSINMGDLLTLVCALIFAGHISLTSILAHKENPGELVLVQMFIAAVLGVVATTFLGEKPGLSYTSVGAILYLGVFSTMAAFFLQTIGQKYSTATKAAILLSTESLFGALLAVIIFNDRLSGMMIGGCVLIFFSIIISETKLSFLKIT